MASGTIIGMCKICKELIWEDEEYIEYDIHKKCLEKDKNLLAVKERIELIKNNKDKELLYDFRCYLKEKIKEIDMILESEAE